MKSLETVHARINNMAARSHSSCFKTSNKAAVFIQYGDKDK